MRCDDGGAKHGVPWGLNAKPDERREEGVYTNGRGGRKIGVITSVGKGIQKPQMNVTRVDLPSSKRFTAARPATAKRFDSCVSPLVALDVLESPVFGLIVN